MSALKIFLATLPFFLYFLVHYLTANVYASVCAPLSLQGFLFSFLTTASPMCNGLLTIMNFTSDSYSVIVTTSLTIGVTIIASWIES